MKRLGLALAALVLAVAVAPRADAGRINFANGWISIVNTTDLKLIVRSRQPDTGQQHETTVEPRSAGALNACCYAGGTQYVITIDVAEGQRGAGRNVLALRPRLCSSPTLHGYARIVVRQFVSPGGFFPHISSAREDRGCGT